MDICPVCKTPRNAGGAFCDECGYRFQDKRCPRCNSILDSQSVFCRQCGYKLTDEIPAPANNISPNPPRAEQPQRMSFPQAQAPVYNNPPMQNPMPKQQVPNYSPPVQNPVPIQQGQGFGAQPQKAKSGKAVKIIVIAAAVVAVLVAAFFLSRPLWDRSSEQASTSNLPSGIEKRQPATPKCSYEAVSVIRPALYQSTDYVIYFRGTSEEDKEAILTVEIPGFTQKYEQKVTLTSQETKLKVHPPMIDGVLGTLNIKKDTQLKVSLLDVSTKNYIIQDSKPVTILSKNDMKWGSDDGSETYYENICAWVTPESPKIKELLRNSVDQLTVWSNGSVDAIVGYQQIGDLAGNQITYYQVAAMYETLRSFYGVRYLATPISTSGPEAQQRIALPEEVISQKSGLCIETAVTMASAIEATGMHPMVLILPGHAQVAVETWQNSGEYYLIETTALTEPDWDNIIYYLDKEQWADYLDDNQVTVVDVELARKDGIKPMQ